MIAQNLCAEIRIRAERRAGELLKEQELNKGGRPSENRSHDVTGLDEQPKLEDLGITKNQSSRWQREAEVPEVEFEAHIATIKDEGKELTSNSVLRLAHRYIVSRERPA